MSIIPCRKKSTRRMIYSSTSGKSGRWGFIRHLPSNGGVRTTRDSRSSDISHSSSLQSPRAPLRTREHSRLLATRSTMTDHGHFMNLRKHKHCYVVGTTRVLCEAFCCWSIMRAWTSCRPPERQDRKCLGKRYEQTNKSMSFLKQTYKKP